MADTQKILIDVEVQSNALIETKKQIDALKESKKALGKITDENRVQNEEYTQQIRILNTEAKKYQKEIDNNQKLLKSEKESMLALEAEISNLTIKYKAMSKEQRNSADGKALNDNINNLKTQLNGANEGIGNFQAQVGNYANKIREALGINNSFVNSVFSIAQQYKEASDASKKYSNEVSVLKSNISKIAETNKDATVIENNSVKSKFNLSNILRKNATDAEIVEKANLRLSQGYKLTAIEQSALTESLKITGGELKEVNGVFQIVQGSTAKLGNTFISQGVTSVKAFGTALWSLAMNPIVITLASITAVALILYSTFKNFKPVTDKIEQAFSALSAVFGVFKSTILDVFTGAKSLSEAFGSMGGEMKKATNEAMRLKKAQQELEDSQAGLEVSNKRIETQIQKLLLQSKNRSLSEKERQQLIVDAMKLDEDRHKANMDYATKEVEQAAKQLMLGKNLTIQQKKDIYSGNIDKIRALQESKLITDEEIDTYKNAILKKEELNQQSIQLQEKAQNRLDALEEKRISNQEKALAKREKEAEKQKTDYEKMISNRANIYKLLQQTETEQIQAVKREYKQANEDLLKDTEIKGNELIFLKMRLAKEEARKIQEIKNKYTGVEAMSAELQKQYANEFIEAKNNQRRLLEMKVLFYETELQQAKLIREKQKDLSIDIQRENDKAVLEAEQNLADSKQSIQNLSTQTQLNNVRNNQDLEYQIKKDALDKELKAVKGNVDEEARIKKELFDLEQANNDRLLAQRVAIANQTLSIATSLSNAYKANEDKQLNKTTEANDKKKESLKAQMDAGIITQEKYNKEVAKLDKEADKQKAIIARKQAIRNRNLALFQITINTAEAVSKAGANPYLIALALAMGAAETAVVMNTEIPKASRGRYISGKSHASGGEIIEAEGGEVVINRKSVSMYRSQLSAINQAGGGVSFGNGGTIGFNDGGYSMRNNQYGMNGLTKADLVEALQGLTIVTTIEDIKREEKKYNKITSSGTF